MTASPEMPTPGKKTERKEADPRFYSIRGYPKKDLGPEQKLGYGERLYTDKEGRHFYAIGEKASDQMLLSRLLKGVVPVSDVVYIKDQDGGEFYSHSLFRRGKDALENVDKNFEVDYGLEELDVDILLLQYIFSDGDHGPRGTPQRVTEFPLQPEGAYSNIDRQRDNFSFFDFHHFERHFWEESGKEFLHKFLKENLQKFNPHQKAFLTTRLKQLRDRVTGEQGTQFLKDILSSIEKETGMRPKVITVAPGENKLSSLQEELTKRIEQIQKEL